MTDPSSILMLLARGAIVLALALAVARLLRRAPAALRGAALVSALAAALALPALAALVPAWHAGALPVAAPEAIEPPGLPVAEAAGPAPAPAPSPVAGLLPAAPSPAPWGAIALALWAAGAAVVLLRAALGALGARRIARRGAPARGAGAYVAAAWRELGGRGAPPAVVESREIEAPFVVGAFAPVLVVPRGASAWTAERWRVVLLHELAHVRRRDGLGNLVARLACSLHWPDPLAWLAARRLREERELAADDAVLRAGARASTYAEHLVAIAAGAVSPPAPAAALAIAEPSRLGARVEAMLDGGRARGPAGAGPLAAVAAAAGLVAAAAACVSLESAPARAEPAPPRLAPLAAQDPALQSAAAQELERVMTAHHASGAIAIVLEARTGAVLALATRGDGDARAARSPGSTMKPFTFAAALEAGTLELGARVDCEGGARAYGAQKLTDASPHGVLDLGGILAVSSNVCAAKIAEPLGDRLGEALRRYHFAAPDHVDTRSLVGASIASGEGIAASALDVAAGYTALADAGLYHAPGGSSGRGGERVMAESTARALLSLLERVVTDAEGTGHAARIDGVRVAGKTGTARTRVAGRFYASFVGIVPADAPRFVVLVGVDGVTGSGGKVAAPVFAKLAAWALAR